MPCWYLRGRHWPKDDGAGGRRPVSTNDIDDDRVSYHQAKAGAKFFEKNRNDISFLSIDFRGRYLVLLNPLSLACGFIGVVFEDRGYSG